MDAVAVFITLEFLSFVFGDGQGEHVISRDSALLVVLASGVDSGVGGAG